MTTDEERQPVRVGPVAAGGHCVARVEGRVIFVRHALPGELVRIRVTDRSRDRLWRADAVEIVEASPDRIEPRCPIACPGGCGGCDFQFVTAPAQRELKRQVVAEQMERIAGLTWTGEVEDCGDPFGWRTRMRYVRDPVGRLGMRAHRSNDVVALPEEGCAIAAARTAMDLNGLGAAGDEIVVAGTAAGPSAACGEQRRGPDPVVEEALGHRFSVAVDGFWQVHPAAPATLVGAALDAVDPRPGERAWDLFCGVGLFAAALSDAGCRVEGVEGSRAAVASARRNVPGARFFAGDVTRTLPRLHAHPDVVVLDPPRAGAGSRLMRMIAERSPRAVAYVSCDPATLARDLKQILAAGYELAGLRAFDLFPQTHHVECVAALRRCDNRR